MAENNNLNLKEDNTMEEKKFTVSEYHLLLSNKIYNEPNSTPEILDSLRFCLLFEIYEGNLSKESLEELQNLCKEISEMTKKTPNELIEDYHLEVDENGKLL